MAQPKPLASLTATLLARKGQARPAMRPQLLGGFQQPALDDLGWNDMGDAPQSPAAPTVAAPAPVAVPVPVPMPEVLVQREVLEQEYAAPEAVRPVSVATAARLRRETAHRGKAAFTLRLDTDRHLRLRLASAVSHQSAQQLVTSALDQLLARMPEVDALVAQLPAVPAKSKRR